MPKPVTRTVMNMGMNMITSMTQASMGMSTIQMSMIQASMEMNMTITTIMAIRIRIFG